MKFGEHLQKEIFPPWKLSYISYETLKKDLKSRQLDHVWNQQDEQSFRRILENELSKVYDFVTAKLSEIESRINYCERTIQTFKGTNWSTDENWKLMEDALTETLFDVNDLAQFTRLNYTGFQKILKKHDKYTHLDLQQSFIVSLRAKPLDNQRLDLALAFISALHDLCKRRGQPNKDLGPFDDREEKEETTRYWVHPDNITEVRSILMLHLPVLMDTPGFEQPSISIVYLDSSQFGKYTSLLQRDDGAEAIRLVTHGTETTLSAEKGSLKIQLDHKDVYPFLVGAYTPKGASELQKEFQGVEPVCRVFYHRTTFGDNQVTLDSELTFIREDNFLRSRRRASGEWQRPAEYPFDLPETEILRFPYAILEAHLEGSPEWLKNLLKSHLVHEVPRFSKYLHGVSYLFRDQLPLLPWWLSEMEIDIRKPPTKFGLSRSKSFKPLLDGQYSRAVETEQQRIDLTNKGPEKLDRVTLDRNKSVNDWENRPHRMKSTLVSKGEDPLNYGPLKRTEKKEGDTLGEDIIFTRGDIRLNVGRPFESANMYVKDPNNPNAVIPVKKVKVEPKVFFSNERTFISWLQFCALLLTVALNLLNFGDKVSRIAGALFISIAAAVAIYALYQFEKRAYMINRQIVGRYDDLWGPAVLCVLVVGALVVNFYLRFR
ncbi:VTC domain-containing protein [Sporodiniella umbellata]|nr:VTC domain-containing protein [Sporodiniella umbellata]